MKTLKLTHSFWTLFLIAANGIAAPLSCDFSQYQPTEGIRAELKGDLLQLSWEGSAHQQVQVSFGLQGTSPVIREMSVRKMGGARVILGQDLSPEFNVTTGRRRISQQQLEPLTKLGLDRNTEFLEQEKWKVFWDAPLGFPARPAPTRNSRGAQTRFGALLRPTILAIAG